MEINSKNRSALIVISLFVLLTSCGPKETGETEAFSEPESISSDSLMTLVQYQTFQYFWEGAEPTSGMARERFHTMGSILKMTRMWSLPEVPVLV